MRVALQKKDWKAFAQLYVTACLAPCALKKDAVLSLIFCNNRLNKL